MKRANSAKSSSPEIQEPVHPREVDGEVSVHEHVPNAGRVHVEVGDAAHGAWTISPGTHL
jgi:hypothetical protein